MSSYKTPEDSKDDKENKQAASQPKAESLKNERYEPGNSPMLLLKRRDSEMKAFAYAFLLKTEFLGSDGEDVIYLDYGFCVASLAGRNLGELYRKICEHDVKYIPVVGSEIIEKHGQGVREIHVEPKKEDKEKGA